MPRKEPGFAERLQTAVKSKQAQLEKIRTATQASEPKPAEAPSDETKAAAERKARNAERKEADKAIAKRKEDERAAAKAAQVRATAEAKERKEAERVARAQAEAALKVDQKAARDAKYAARKARQK